MVFYDSNGNYFPHPGKGIQDVDVTISLVETA